MVDISKIQVGDEVTIRVRVTACCFDQESPYISATSEVGDNWSVKIDRIVTHAPKPREIKVGDTVTWEFTMLPWTVMALDGTVAWLKSESVYTQMLVEKLRHA